MPTGCFESASLRTRGPMLASPPGMTTRARAVITCSKSVFGSKGMIRWSVNRSRSFASISGVTLPSPVLRMRRRLAWRPLVTPIWWNARLMVIRSDLDGMTDADVRRALAGLPHAGDYAVVVKPLRYRSSPHLAARCEFEERRIVLQVPVPFHPFREPVIFAARRKRGHGIRFAWASQSVSFRLRREVLRFVYCHEWMHWYLHEVLGKKSEANTACDRVALRKFT